MATKPPSMKMRDSFNWARTNRKKPTDIIVAFETEARINEVILHGPYRIRITRQLTKAEFEAQDRATSQRPDGVRATMTAHGARVQTSTIEDVAELPGEFRYYYAAELIQP